MNILKILALTCYALVGIVYYFGVLGNSLEKQTNKMEPANQATTPVKTTSPSAFQPSASQVAPKTTSAAPPLSTTASNSTQVPNKKSGSENRPQVKNTEVLGFEQALQLADRGDARAQAIVSIYYGIGYKTKKDTKLLRTLLKIG
jgi:hypothetical protein